MPRLQRYAQHCGQVATRFAWFGVCFGLVTGPARAEGLPLLVCNEPEYHFGALSNTNEVPHTFVLANEGDAPLTISRVHPDC
ncbi:MAG: DUF1573 domain-containing protein, partial [Lentisphaerae bacterium]|nr:DUF1573 domain-containing protein [Lentisphaerota bacterium]